MIGFSITLMKPALIVIPHLVRREVMMSMRSRREKISPSTRHRLRREMLWRRLSHRHIPRRLRRLRRSLRSGEKSISTYPKSNYFFSPISRLFFLSFFSCLHFPAISSSFRVIASPPLFIICTHFSSFRSRRHTIDGVVTSTSPEVPSIDYFLLWKVVTSTSPTTSCYSHYTEATKMNQTKPMALAQAPCTHQTSSPSWKSSNR